MKIATSKVKNWIFVTGAGRSGTTFVGQVLSIPREVDYFHEPFNEACGIPSIKGRPGYLRKEEVSEHAQVYEEAIDSILTYSFRLRNTFHEKDSYSRRLIKRVVGSRGPYYLRLAKLNPFHTTAVIKDPTAPFLTEFLYTHYNVKPVIVLRHPVSLASSIGRVGWWPDLSEFLGQPRLIEDYFSDERDLLFAKNLTNYEKVAVYWRCVYKVLLSQVSEYKKWQVIKIEDLSENPLDRFKDLFASLEINWSKKVETKVYKMTNAKKIDIRQGGVMELKRDSKSIFAEHRDAVSLSDRTDMYRILNDVIEPYYTRESFALDEGQL